MSILVILLAIDLWFEKFQLFGSTSLWLANRL